MLFLTLFQFLTRLLTPSTWNPLVHTSCGEMEQCEKRAFRHLKMRKIISWNLKTKCVTDFLLAVRSSWWAHKRLTFTLISIKVWEFGSFLFTRNRLFKHKEVVSNPHVCSNGLGKIWPSYIFHFSTRILTSPHIKGFNILRIIYVAMSNNQFSALDNVNMTCQTRKY